MANKLPEPCEECAPDGYWASGPNGGLTRCHCPRGQALRMISNRPAPPERAESVLTGDEISLAVEGLAAIPFFPSEESARTMIGDAIAALCADSRSCLELVRRMLVMYRKWPGVREMRICYCAMIGTPLSGDDLRSEVSVFYPEGFGRSVGSIPSRVALPPGHVSTADAELDEGIRNAAKRLDMNRR
jgi:hypothetical protein